MSLFKTALDTVKTLVEIINTISDIGVIHKLGEKFGENLTKADVRDWRYRLFGSISDADEALFIRAENELHAEGKSGSILAYNQTAARLLTSEMQDRHRLKMLGIFDPTDKDQATAAVKQIKDTIELYAQLPEPAWEDLKTILNLAATAAQSKWDRFSNWIGTNIPIALQTIADATKQVGSALKTGAVATGRAAAAKYAQTGDNWQATGVNDAIGAINRGLLDFIRRKI